MTLTVFMKESGLMNRLEGYNTNGHEYRKSQIDRSNSRRLEWLMNEAKKNVEAKDYEATKPKNSFIRESDSLEEIKKLNKNIAVNTNNQVNNSNVFKPNNVNLFSRSNTNNPFNKKG